jgi:hypothetical protein
MKNTGNDYTRFGHNSNPAAEVVKIDGQDCMGINVGSRWTGTYE